MTVPPLVRLAWILILLAAVLYFGSKVTPGARMPTAEECKAAGLITC